MSTRFHATFSEYFTSTMSDDTLLKAIVTSLDNLAWNHKVVSSIEVQATVGMSLWSFGEKLKVRILSGGRVYAESKGNSSIYHNKNKSNVTNFLTQLRKVTLAYAELDALVKYQEALEILKGNPNDADLRETTLYIGRLYSNLSRDKTGATQFDEIALMNDINAACAGSITVSNEKEAHLKPRSIEERLIQLKDLWTNGLIDESEYDSKRQRLLDEL